MTDYKCRVSLKVADKEYIPNQEIAVKIKAVNNMIYGFTK